MTISFAVQIQLFYFNCLLTWGFLQEVFAYVYVLQSLPDNFLKYFDGICQEFYIQNKFWVGICKCKGRVSFYTPAHINPFFFQNHLLRTFSFHPWVIPVLLSRVSWPWIYVLISQNYVHFIDIHDIFLSVRLVWFKWHGVYFEAWNCDASSPDSVKNAVAISGSHVFPY